MFLSAQWQNDSSKWRRRERERESREDGGNSTCSVLLVLECRVLVEAIKRKKWLAEEEFFNTAQKKVPQNILPESKANAPMLTIIFAVSFKQPLTLHKQRRVSGRFLSGALWGSGMIQKHLALETAYVY